MTTPRKGSWRAVGAAGVAMALLAACGTASEREGSTSELPDGVSEEVAAAIAAEPEMNMVDMDFPSATVQAETIVQIIERLGGTAKMTTMTDHIAVWPAMVRDTSMVTPEVWDMLFTEQIDEYVEQEGTVAEIGTSPITGEEGWYVPTYVIEGDAERGIEPMCPGLPDWEALNDCAEVFATAETGDKGRYLTGAPAWAEYYGDTDRIKNLELDYELVVAGSEPAAVAELKRAYDRGEPWLGLMWRPHYATMRYDLTLIEFPPFTEECWGTTYACAWDDLNLVRYASTEFFETNPLTAALIGNNGMNDDQMADVLTEMEEEGATAEEAVSRWLDENTDVWVQWIPTEVSAASAS